MSIIVTLIQKQKQISFAGGQQKPAGYTATNTDKFRFADTADVAFVLYCFEECTFPFFVFIKYNNHILSSGCILYIKNFRY